MAVAATAPHYRVAVYMSSLTRRDEIVGPSLGLGWLVGPEERVRSAAAAVAGGPSESKIPARAPRRAAGPRVATGARCRESEPHE